MSKQISHTTSFNISVSIGLKMLSHIFNLINGCEICLNTTNYPIVKISDIDCAPSFWTVLIRWYPHFDHDD